MQMLNYKAIPEYLRRPLYKTSLFLILDSSLTAGVGFFFWIIVAKFYNTTDVGYGSAAISAMTLIAMLSDVGMSSTLIRFLPKADKPQEIVNTYMTLSSVMALVLAAVFLAGVNIWSPALSFIKANPIFGAAFIVFTIVYSAGIILRFVFIAGRRADLSLIINTIQSVLKLPLAIWMVLYFHSFGIAAAWGIATAAAVFCAIAFLLPRCQTGYKPLPTFNVKIIRTLWGYSTGNSAASLFANAPIWILPIIVINVSGSEQNAYFYIVWTIASLLTAIPLATSNSLFVEGSHVDETLDINLRRTLKFTYLLLIPAILVFFLMGSYILSFFGEAYSLHGAALLKIMAVSSVFSALNMIYSSILRINNRIRELVIICSIQAALLLAGSYIILPVTGITGVGYIWLGVQGLNSVYAGYRMRKDYRGSDKPGGVGAKASDNE